MAKIPLHVGVAVALMTAVQPIAPSFDPNCNSHSNREPWKGTGKRRKPKQR